MKFDVFFTCESPAGNAAKDYGELLEQIEHAEHLGFEGVWLAEHHGSNYGIAPSPAILLATIAERTRTMLLGPGVSILPFSHPVRVAEEYAMVDVLSGGRLRFGTGRGYQPREFKMFGAEPSESREVYQESIEVIRGLWENESFSYQGRYYQIHDVTLNPKPIQRPVPMWVAAASPESFTLAARNGVQVYTQPSLRQTVDEMRANMAAATQAFVEQGWDPAAVDIPVNVLTHVAPTAEEARAAAAGPLAWHFDKLRSLAPGADGRPIAKGYESYKSYGPLNVTPTASAAGAGGTDDRVSIDSLNQSRIAIVGDPDEARRSIAELQQAIGLEHMTCFVRFGGLPHESVMSSMELWASEVMPAFQQSVRSTAAV